MVQNDLYNLVNLNLERARQSTRFWGRFEYLNKINTSNMTDSILFKKQLIKLKMLEQSKQKQYQSANEFLKAINQSKSEYLGVGGLQDSDIDENKIYKRILEILNAGLASSPMSPVTKNLTAPKDGKRSYLPGKNKETQKQDQQALIKDLETLTEMMDMANRGNMSTRLKYEFKGFGVKKKSIKDGFSSYKQYKADEAENLIVEALLKSGLYEKAVKTGSFYDPKSQQLLEDAFAFDVDFVFGNDLSFYTKSKGSKGKGDLHIVKSLYDFVDQVKDLETSVSVYLTDELYDALKKHSAIAAQAKSGYKLQELLNETAERNTIRLQDIGNKQILESLHELQVTGWLDGESESLERLANYWLSKSVLLTNITANQIYFTRDGFITASTWMEMYNQMLKFNPAVRRVNNSFLSERRSYSFKPVKKS